VKADQYAYEWLSRLQTRIEELERVWNRVRELEAAVKTLNDRLDVLESEEVSI